MAAAPATHAALVFAGARKPYEVQQRPTADPVGDEILIRSHFTASTPLDLHRADGGLLIAPGDLLGSVTAGVVQKVGPDASSRLRVGDRVFGWAFQEPRYKAHQEFVTAPEWLFGKVPDNLSMEEAATVPENLITAFNTMATDLGLPTPWPKPAGYVPARADEPILVWGAGASVGQSCLQLLRYYGYRQLFATAAPAHHAHLRGLGAAHVFDYRAADVGARLLDAAAALGFGHRASDGGEQKQPAFPMIIDCVGSLRGTLEPIVANDIAQPGSTVAVMLPVIVRHASADAAPEYAMDVLDCGLAWPEGVHARGVRTFFVFRNAFFKEKLPSEILPALLAQGVFTPQRYRLVPGETMLERATNALNALRDGVSGEKLVWRTSNE